MSFVHLITLYFKFRLLVCLNNKASMRCILAYFYFLHGWHISISWPVVKKTTVIVLSIMFCQWNSPIWKRELKYKELRRIASILLLWMHGYVYMMLGQKEIHTVAFSSRYVILWLKRLFISSAITPAFKALIRSDKTQPSCEFYCFYLLKLSFPYTAKFKSEIAMAVW